MTDEKKEEKKSQKCTAKTEVFSRCVGYFSPVQQWNKGKQEEYRERVNFNIKKGEDER